jgi:hypothetical protein
MASPTRTNPTRTNPTRANRHAALRSSASETTNTGAAGPSPTTASTRSLPHSTADPGRASPWT